MATPSFDPAQITYTDGSGNIRTVADIAGKVLVLSLHGRGDTSNLLSSSRKYTATVSGELAYNTHNTVSFNFSRDDQPRTPEGTYAFFLTPRDNYAGVPDYGTSRWMGLVGMTGATLNKMTERRILALLEWAQATGNFDPRRLCSTGFSMGAYGTMQIALRRPDLFAAVYPDSPQWHHSYSPTKITHAHYTKVWQDALEAASPYIREEDGGERLYDLVNHLEYISDPKRKIPWIGYAIHTGTDGSRGGDGASPFSEHLEAYEILKSTGRGFAFYWAPGGHLGGLMSNITASYPYGTFRVGEGYPCFRNHTLDANPYVDAEGGINIGLKFRAVVETPTSWACEVTSTRGACEVDVTPISDIFKLTVAAKRAVIPGANQWVSVTFPN